MENDILKIVIPLYIGVLLITHLIPFRVGLPISIINMEDGSRLWDCVRFSTMDVTGPSVTVALFGFTGITINIPFEEESFLFVSGFSLMTQAKSS